MSEWPDPLQPADVPRPLRDLCPAAHVELQGLPFEVKRQQALIRRAASIKGLVFIGQPPCRREALRDRVRTAKLQPVIVQRLLLRTLMKDARRGSIR